MKKITVILIILLISGFAFAATVDTGTLTAYGKVATGTATFAVTQTQLSNQQVDLTLPIVASTGDGYVIGSWEFNADNQATAISYTVTYTYGELTNGTYNIEYTVLEYAEGASTGGTAKATGGTTTVNASTGDNNVVKNIGFRLTATGDTDVETAPGSINYQDTITITMTTT
ncbi:MAG: hypothetical protein AB7S52_01890 [Sphaerochaetaceae bacterium]